MPFVPITINDGQVSGVDNLSGAASSVVNWEVDEAGVNIPRPPLNALTVANIGTSPIIGLERWKDYIVSVHTDRTVRVIHESGPGAASSVSTSSTATQIEGTKRPTFVVGQDYVYIAGGGRIQRWTSTLANTEVISGSPNCTHIASIGQRLVANNTDDRHQFKWSDIGEGTWATWPAANSSDADARPDPIVGIFENLSELYVMGESTMQAYAVGSDPTLPFDLVSAVNIGLSAPYAVCRLDANLALLDDRRRIVISDGRSATSIGDAIQKDIRGFTTISDCWMYREERGQRSLLVVRFPTERRTFVYDLVTQKWTERDYYEAPFHRDWPVNAAVYWPTYNQWLLSSSLTTAGLFELGTTGAENSNALVCERVTGWDDCGTKNRKRSVRIRATMRRGTAAQNATPGSLEMRVQYDDSPWSTWRQISVGEPHQFSQTRDLFFGGIFRRCRRHIRYSNTEQMSLVSLDHEIQDLGAP